MASSSFRIPPGKTIGDITDVRSQKIRDWLKTVDFKLDDAAIDAAIKHRLQTILALYNLGILRKGCGPDEALLATVTDWCSITVEKLVGKLKCRGLDMNGSRWKHIEVLIRAELDNGESALAKLSVATPDNVIDDATESTPAISQGLTPSPAVMNLLLTTIYAEVARSKDLASLPGCPTPTVNLVLDQLNTVCAFKTPQELEAVRKAPLTPAKILLNSISNKYGDQLKEATASLKIKVMPSSVLQFVVSKPTKELQDAFVVRKAAKNGVIILLFHGTRLPTFETFSGLTSTPKLVSYGHQANHGFPGTMPPASLEVLSTFTPLPCGKVTHTRTLVHFRDARSLTESPSTISDFPTKMSILMETRTTLW